MSSDHTLILKLAESNNGIISKKLIQDELKWDLFRIENIINFMLKDGIIWIDVYTSGGIVKHSYYFPSLFSAVYL
jgi:hypothetical protein